MNPTKHKILLVDDDPDDAEFTLYTLGKLNFFDFHHIDDGAVAMEYIFSTESSAPAAILLDLKMPKVDGIEILGKLKSDPNKMAIPVFVLISSQDGKRYVESFSLKADGYLIKPVDCQSFLEAISKAGVSNYTFSSSSNFTSVEFPSDEP